MKCPRDRKTTLVKQEDYLDYCPHCGIEVFATKRAVNDVVKNKNGIWDYSLPLDKFLNQFDEGFRSIGYAAYCKVKGLSQNK